MNKNTYALSRIERLWMLYSITFLVCAICYGLLIGRLITAGGSSGAVSSLQDLPVLLLISLSVGFFFTGAGNYVIRQSMRPVKKEVIS
ncbi:hypothetical protein RJE46_24755 (plasmid) [Cedecea neteri]|uniref:hypothetical protein n=1 Tax=Cedecea neteri TaxID=158822 RepID=UPI002892A761|nr:hypothetical protein [Cedecea neteri]WNJ82286.1 hypothetical protein RJE46_24755 [Cedecea neteri]